MRLLIVFALSLFASSSFAGNVVGLTTEGEPIFREGNSVIVGLGKGMAGTTDAAVQIGELAKIGLDTTAQVAVIWTSPTIAEFLSDDVIKLRSQRSTTAALFNANIGDKVVRRGYVEVQEGVLAGSTIAFIAFNNDAKDGRLEVQFVSKIKGKNTYKALDMFKKIDARRYETAKRGAREISESMVKQQIKGVANVLDRQRGPVVRDLLDVHETLVARSGGSKAATHTAKKTGIFFNKVGSRVPFRGRATVQLSFKAARETIAKKVRHPSDGRPFRDRL